MGVAPRSMTLALQTRVRVSAYRTAGEGVRERLVMQIKEHPRWSGALDYQGVHTYSFLSRRHRWTGSPLFRGPRRV